MSTIKVIIQQVLDAPQSISCCYQALHNRPLPFSVYGIGNRGGSALLIYRKRDNQMKGRVVCVCVCGVAGKPCGRVV